MGTYVNPGNDGFRRVVAGEYVDKTGLIARVNEGIGTLWNLTCVSRPRRFGKSVAAESLVAYYSCGCDSRELFEGLEISRDPSFERHLNAYNVVRLDMTEVAHASSAPIEERVTQLLLPELAALTPDVPPHGTLAEALLGAVRATGRKFFFVIDEWDAVFRVRRDDTAAQRAYVDFLRLLFKNASFTAEAVAGAYLTGILPIKKYGTQSALNDFREHTMVRPGRLAPYTGFTEGEVRALCDAHGMDFGEMRRWYDGYDLPGAGPVYAPNSVMEACRSGAFGPYWVTSETYESLRLYIDMDFDGLQGDIVRAVGGESLPVNPYSFQNDMVSVRGRDDVLTLLVHLGYLAYDEGSGTVRVPNEEVRIEFRNALERSSHAEVARIVRESDDLLAYTLDEDEEAVAAAIARAHDASTAPAFYNGEQALRAVVKAAYISAVDQYATIEELPSGRGLADVVYLPKRGSQLPALVVELKWDRTAEGALAQIRDRDYPAVLRGWGGPVLLVGVSYDSRTKEHACRIERLAARG